MSSPPLDAELARLLARLPQAASLDLYHLEIAIRKLRDDPRRILEVRQHLHLGMTVRFLSVRDGTMHGGKIVAMRDRDVTIDDANQNSRWTGVPYVAIDLHGTSTVNTVEIVDDAPAPSRGARSPTKADFRIGDSATFVARDGRIVFGRIVRLNQKTASLECDNGTWRVSYVFLQPVVDV